MEATSTIDESAVSGVDSDAIKRPTRPPRAPGVSNRRSEPLFSLKPVVTGLHEPVYVAAAPGERDRLYLVLRAGLIRVLEDSKLREEPFLDISGRVRTEIEEGLHSVAFHPSYADNHRLYVDYNDRKGDIHVVEYRSDGERVLPATARSLLVIDKPEGVRWHNGGQLQFGPDGLLYVSMGDAARNPLDPIQGPHPTTADPDNHAQNLSLLFGKLLTIDVDSPTPRIRIAAYGLRNTWRFSFDRANGDLYLADVGQFDYEEIDYLPGGFDFLPNFGWSIYEGNRTYNEDHELGRIGQLIWPIVVYPHGSPRYCEIRGSVTGGYVYRGEDIPQMTGRYVFGDFCSNEVWSLRVGDGRAVDVRKEPVEAPAIVSFGEDSDGELYAVALLEGTIYRLGPVQ
jgi:glucose/arabinose dehydrogenase